MHFNSEFTTFTTFLLPSPTLHISLAVSYKEYNFPIFSLTYFSLRWKLKIAMFPRDCLCRRTTILLLVFDIIPWCWSLNEQQENCLTNIAGKFYCWFKFYVIKHISFFWAFSVPPWKPQRTGGFRRFRKRSVAWSVLKSFIIS